MAKLDLDTDLQLLPVPTTPVFQRGRVGLVMAATALALSTSGCSDDDRALDSGRPLVFDGGITLPEDGGAAD